MNKKTRFNLELTLEEISMLDHSLWAHQYKIHNNDEKVRKNILAKISKIMEEIKND